jgi:AcrR family transcriptional regulator
VKPACGSLAPSDTHQMAEAARSLPQDEALVRQRRRQIFLAACRVLARKSFHQASVKELALEAGLAAGSIYVYLESKDEILVLIAESMVDELVEQLPAIRARAHDDPRRELLEMMRAVLDVIDRYREAFTVLHNEARYLERRPQYRDATRRIVGRYRSAVAGVIERGRAAGVIRCENIDSAVHTVHMLCAGWAMGGNALRNVDKETYWREIAALIRGGLFSPHASNGTDRAANLRPVEES